MSDLVELGRWSGPDENDGEWPYPDEFTKSLVTGELAARCRVALGAPEDWPVYITEREVSGGYSEYTQENWSDFTIECGEQSVTFEESGWGDNTFEQLIKWLDKHA